MNAPKPERFLSQGFVIALVVVATSGVLIASLVLYVASLGPPRSEAVAALAAPAAAAHVEAHEPPDLIASASGGVAKSPVSPGISRIRPWDDAIFPDELTEALDEGLTLAGIEYVKPLANAEGAEATAKDRDAVGTMMEKYLIRKLDSEDIPMTGSGKFGFVSFVLTSLELPSGLVFHLALEVRQAAKVNGRRVAVVTWSQGTLWYGPVGRTSMLQHGIDGMVRKLADDWRRTHGKATPKPIPARAASRSSSPCDPPWGQNRPVAEIARSQGRRGEPTRAPIAANDGNWELKQ